MSLPILPTTVVGSYPQPGWLVDHEMMMAVTPPRVRMAKVWRFAGDELKEAQDDATRLAVRDMEDAGLDIVTDGEIRRESYFNLFATALSGIDLDRPGEMPDRSGAKVPVPRVVGPIRRLRPVQLDDYRFLRSITGRQIKMTVPGPFTMSQLAIDEYYRDEGALIAAYADAVNAELKDLKDAGCDVVQIDEPYLQAKPEKARKYGVDGINRALAGVAAPTIVHMCFGYAYAVKDKPTGYSFLPELDRCCSTQVSLEAAQPRLDPHALEGLPSKTVVLGVLDLGDPAVETAEVVADRIRGALASVDASRLVIAPDCGMKYLPRETALGKLKAMVAGTSIVREELRERKAS
ncbi:MAG: 5-methyltetrahydropteroyltriglutamate--homocysteine methyltransferase [Rhizobiaceae bacterium]|nr:5-methyltetrahydropteroyltriglutamate--homocysteine methyltransferase [Rhizobiaceae bacterium]